jgi:hypothetical protein
MWVCLKSAPNPVSVLGRHLNVEQHLPDGRGLVIHQPFHHRTRNRPNLNQSSERRPPDDWICVTRCQHDPLNWDIRVRISHR